MKMTTRLVYYWPEVKRLILLAAAIAALVAVIVYRSEIADNLFSEKGMTILMGVAIAGVTGTVVRIYYRVMVIRYGPVASDRK